MTTSHSKSQAKEIAIKPNSEPSPERPMPTNVPKTDPRPQSLKPLPRTKQILMTSSMVELASPLKQALSQGERNDPMKIATTPEPVQIQELMKGPAETPVVMVNLLSFKQEADGQNTGMSGAESYARYGEKMKAFVESKGGRFLFMGRVDSMVLGESDHDFQVVALVEYPNRQTFLEIASSPYVADIGKNRSEGLAGQWLIATTQSDNLPET